MFKNGKGNVDEFVDTCKHVFTATDQGFDERQLDATVKQNDPDLENFYTLVDEMFRNKPQDRSARERLRDPAEQVEGQWLNVACTLISVGQELWIQQIRRRDEAFSSDTGRLCSSPH